MGMPGLPEMLIIGLIAVMLFGNRLPSAARSIGSSYVAFKKGLRDVEELPRDLKKDIDEATKK
jgi:sec-independent protein translocase protein TatA